MTLYLPTRGSYRLRTFIIILYIAILLYPAVSFGKTELIVGIYENKPLVFSSKEDTPSGLFIDILEAIAEAEDWKLVFKTGHWDSLFSDLSKKQIDLLPVVAFSEERQRLFDFNDETVMANWAEIYSSKNTTLSSLLDLEGKRVAVKMGDIHFTALKELTQKFNIHCRFIEADEYQTIFEMLNAGYLDIGIVNRMFGRANLQNYAVKISPIIFNPIEVRFAAAKNLHRDLLTTLDTYLAKYKNDSESIYYSALEKWLMVEPETNIPTSVRYLIGAILITIAFLFIISLFLKHQISKQTKTLVTTNRELQQEIEKNKKSTRELQKYARVVEASSDAIALFDVHHRHLLVNNAYLELFGRTRDDLADTTLADVIGVAFFNQYLRDNTKACLEGKQAYVTAVYQRDNKLCHWHIHLAPYITQNKSVEGYAIDIHDITQMKELETKLKQAQKMETIGLLAGGVAHDLNNILSGLVSYPDMLLVGRDQSDPMFGPLHTIKQSGTRAAAIVSDLLTLARNNVANKKTDNLNVIVSELTASPEYRALFEGRQHISVVTNLEEDLLNLEGSHIHLSKCLLNLITNSFEAMPEGGLVTISTENRYFETARPHPDMNQGEYVLMIVEDTGIGISEQELQHIFEPFYTSKVMGRSGTGLGMTLVWNTVKDHGGCVDVDTYPGRGTKFTLYFPASRNEIAKKSIEEIDDFKGDGQSVLVIDDVPEQRRFAKEILEKLNYSVECAENGEEALRKMEEKAFDILVLDMIMPGGMDGLETYENALRIRPQQKAIIASGYSETANIEKAQQLGAGRYVRKPYTVLSLAAALKEELHQG